MQRFASAQRIGSGIEVSVSTWARIGLETTSAAVVTHSKGLSLEVELLLRAIQVPSFQSQLETGRSRPHRLRRRDGAYVVLRIGYTGVTLTG
jgi:hypothetical protein